MATLEQALGKFELAAEKLNAESDAVNALITQVNTRMTEAGAGLTVWLVDHGTPVLLATDADVGPRNGLQLGFTKVKDRWQLAVRPARLFWQTDPAESESGEDDFASLTDVGEPVALLDAPRIVRVEACEHLLELVESMTERMNVFLKSIARTKAEIGSATRRPK
jgi:hypothetical protein